MLKNLINEYWDSIVSDVPFKKYTLFFNEFKSLLYEKLSLHGMLEFDDYIKHLSKYYSIGQLKQYTYTGKHSNINVTFDDILKVMFEPRYILFRKRYLNNKYYSKLYKLYIDLCNEYNTTHERTVLMERCISAEHKSGSIIGVDIQKLRSDFDKLVLDKSFGILTRNAVDSKIEKLTKPFNAIFIDFNDIHLLNKSMGYAKVNSMFKRLFTEFKFRHDDIVGRWFSGDEIIIITTSNVRELLDRFGAKAKFIGLEFEHLIMMGVTSADELRESLKEL